MFDFAGNFLARVASGGVLNAPWGTALAHPNFGAFGGDLLIGNFGDGRINAFHENADGTWTPSGTLRGLNGQPLFIGGLWAIQFGSGAANNGARNHLYFTAGPNGELAGLFGRIIPNPSEAGGTVPATLSLTLGTPASFGAFTPGVGKDYLASTTANVISSAGDALLSVSDPSSNATGHLVNGAFSLAAALQANATSAGRHRRAAGQRRRLREPDDPADLHRPDEQRRGDGQLQADRRRQRAAQDRHVQQDPDVHAVDDDTVIRIRAAAPRAAARKPDNVQVAAARGAGTLGRMRRLLPLLGLVLLALPATARGRACRRRIRLRALLPA